MLVWFDDLMIRCLQAPLRHEYPFVATKWELAYNLHISQIAWRLYRLFRPIDNTFVDQTHHEFNKTCILQWYEFFFNFVKNEFLPIINDWIPHKGAYLAKTQHSSRDATFATKSE